MSHPSSMDTILQGEFGPPLDYSYRNISSLSSFPSRYPRQSLRKQRRSPSGRYNSNVIRLSNNNLSDTHGLYQLALDLVECPENIAWLDLSFNDIDEVTNDILEFSNLKMIYLHGNKISSLSDLQKLRSLPNLYSLTLHGNPLENYPNYRTTVISMLPNLKSLDFAKVTERERAAQQSEIRKSKRRKKRSL